MRTALVTLGIFIGGNALNDYQNTIKNQETNTAEPKVTAVYPNSDVAVHNNSMNP